MKKVLALLLALLLCVSASAAELLEEWNVIARIEGSENILVCRDDLWGMADEAGNVLLKPQFHNQPAFAGELAVVCMLNSVPTEDVSGSDEYDALWGAINRDGEIVIPLEYDEVLLNDDGSIATVELDRRYGFIGADGKMIAPVKYRDAGTFIEGYAAAARGVEATTDGSFGYETYTTQVWGIVDARGEVAVDFQYDELTLCGGGLAVASEDGKYGCIDMQGKTVIPFEYQHMTVFRGDYAVVGKEFKTDHSTDLSQPNSYTLCGVIDRSGDLVVPLEYDSIVLETNGLARVRADDKYGLVNLQGQEILKPTYRRMRNFVGDHAAVGEDHSGLWGVVSIRGEIVLPLEYDDVKLYEDGTARVRTESERIWFKLEGDAATELRREKAG